MKGREALHGRPVVLVGAALAACIGGATIVGWLLQARSLTNVGWGYIPMAPNTALSFLALGGTLILLALFRNKGASAAGIGAGLAVSAVAAVRLFELLSGIDLVSDEWFLSFRGDYRNDWRPTTSLAPIGRMALPTAVAFVLSGAAVILRAISEQRRRLVDAAGALAAATTGLGLVFVLGYLYGAPLMYESQVIPMALNTALGFAALGTALAAAAGSSAFPLRILTGPSIQARLLRAFLPFAVIAVCLVPWLTSLAGRLAGQQYAALYSSLLVVGASLAAVLLCVGIARRMDAHISRIESQLRQSQKMDALGRLAGGVAHDFNNHLTVINGYCELALDEESLDDAMREKLREIQGAGKSAAALTRQLLLFSRKQDIKPKPLNLNEIISDQSKMLRRLLRENIKLNVRTGADLGMVLADAGQTEQVIMNLVVNARDALSKGGEVTLETANVDFDAAYAGDHPGVVPGPHVMLAVSDTGFGMTEEVKARLFEPFFTTKEVGKGTGMGLATVHAIVKQRGGHITVTSQVGKGTSFRLHFPRIVNPARGDASQEAAAPAPTGMETILVVEDEPAIQSMIREALKRKGYTVLSASDGTEALNICHQKIPIHLMLTDSVMPLMSGPELSKSVLDVRDDIKVVFMSGYTEHPVEAAPLMGAFLQKPFAVDTLLRTVRDILDGKSDASEGKDTPPHP